MLVYLSDVPLLILKMLLCVYLRLAEPGPLPRPFFSGKRAGVWSGGVSRGRARAPARGLSSAAPGSRAQPGSCVHRLRGCMACFSRFSTLYVC